MKSLSWGHMSKDATEMFQLKELPVAKASMDGAIK
jgi:hypothetical protein